MAEDRFDSTLILSTAVGADAEDQIHYLRVTRGAQVGRKIELGTEPLVIGRGDQTDAQIDDAGISKSHCSVKLAFGGAIVEDLDSTNGSFINGDKIEGGGEGLLELGSTLGVGETVLQYERMSREESSRIDRLEEDLERAENYVQALLPAPLDHEAVKVEYRFIPSTRVGGDALGYHWLDDDHFAIYLIDVSGHGAGSGLHSVTAYNSLRKQSLPDVDFREPSQVLSALNSSFQMQEHGNLYLTAWYAVYTPDSRTLHYASAGHPPAILAIPDSDPLELATPSRAVGLFDGGDFPADQVTVSAGSILHVYSDGAYEIETESGEDWGVADLKALLVADHEGDEARSEQIERRVREVLQGDAFEDDFSLLVVDFL